jgi:hypothetical protein
MVPKNKFSSFHEKWKQGLLEGVRIGGPARK